MTDEYYKLVRSVEEQLTDGRLTEPSYNSRIINLREAIKLSKKLGRPLTEVEIKQFEC